MLKKIKSLKGVKKITKKEQKHFKGGSDINGYVCPGMTVLVFEHTCPSGYHIHPGGLCLCCSSPWQRVRG